MGFIGYNKNVLFGRCWGSSLYPWLKASEKLRPICRLSTGTRFPKFCTKNKGVRGQTIHNGRGPSISKLLVANETMKWKYKISKNQRCYLNRRLCSARVVSELAYGRMFKGRWRILYKKTECRLKIIRHLIMACMVLHNTCIASDEPCKARWRLQIENLHLIRNIDNGEQDGEADQVRIRITNWLWDIRQQRHLIFFF